MLAAIYTLKLLVGVHHVMYTVVTEHTLYIVLLCLCVILFVLYTLASGVHKASVHSASLHAYKLKTTTD